MSVNDKSIKAVLFNFEKDTVKVQRFGEDGFTEVFGELKESLKKERGFD